MKTAEYKQGYEDGFIEGFSMDYKEGFQTGVKKGFSKAENTYLKIHQTNQELKEKIKKHERLSKAIKR